jgi:hypothetical protein
MKKNRKAEKPNILAVEGKDECNFFTALIKHLNLTGIQIEDIGGKDKFKLEFSLLAQSENFYGIVKKIGFVRDAEEKEATAAFQSICGILNAYNLPVPHVPNTVIDKDAGFNGQVQHPRIWQKPQQGFCNPNTSSALN